MQRPPVLIFAYNRPFHLERLLESICLNNDFEEFEYFIFVDGPRNSRDIQKINIIGDLLEKYKSVINITVYFSNINLGVNNSIRNNVTKVFKEVNEVIVLEDDLLISPLFLQFMVTALNHFRNMDSCSSISGYRYEIPDLHLSPYVLSGADCWGWATWRDRWERVNWDAQENLCALESAGRISEFDIGGKYKYSEILNDQVNGFVDSWAINWHASMFLLKKFTYYPQIALCQNMGNDGSGVHFGTGKKYHVDLPIPDWNLLAFPTNFHNAGKEFEKYHQKKLNERVSALLYKLRKHIVIVFRKIRLRIDSN